MFKEGGFRHSVQAILMCLIFIIVHSSIALSEETYRFERMWPTLQQPWHFMVPTGIATDKNGSVFVIDVTNNCVQKFTADGQFITKWVNYENSIDHSDGIFIMPTAIAVDKRGDVYVADSWDGRIQKFSSDDLYLSTWFVAESNTDYPRNIRDIAIDEMDNLYVVDSNYDQIRKYTANGSLIVEWGGTGSNEGEFNFDTEGSIAIDKQQHVYVLDTGNNRIQKFDSNGRFISAWGSQGKNIGQFQRPQNIAIDSNDILFIADTDNHRIQKFNTNGGFIEAWGEEGIEDGELYYPISISIDNSGHAYIGEPYYSRVQKFSSNGTFISAWGSGGVKEGQFYNPRGVTLDDNGNLYVVESHNPRIQKFDFEGSFLGRWGGKGATEDFLLNCTNVAVDRNFIGYVLSSYGWIYKVSPDGSYHNWETDAVYDGDIAIDDAGYIYITVHQGVQKLDTNGNIIRMFGEIGIDDGCFNSPQGVAVDSIGNVYISDTANHRVQILNPDGEFLTKWGSFGTGELEFDRPIGIAVDDSQNVYVSDHTFRIQKFTAKGELLSTFGTVGTSAGEFYFPTSLCVTDDGNRVYVADSSNNRIQMFRKGLPTDKTSKAIIIAGRRSLQDTLWTATRICANFAYQALVNQGFTKETIYYLTSDTGLDLDNNGELDDVDGDATNNDTKKAITEWARDADSLVIYMTDHGMPGDFFMSGREKLSATQLDEWLDTLQTETECNKIILIYDACRSGSFLQPLTPPPDGKTRIIITSTRPGEDARYISQGSISFSNYFWTHIFNGTDIRDAFTLASDAMDQSTHGQHPQMDANNGIANEPEDYELARNQYIGNGTKIQGEAPRIESVFTEKLPDANSVRLTATGVTDDDGIVRVWAVLRPPDYQPLSAVSTELEFPSVDLLPAGNDTYEITYDGFNIAGTYQVAIYARDHIGNTCIPSITSVTIENPLRRKAIIIAGGPASAPLWPAVEKNANLSYEALKFQGYSDDDIYFMSPVTFSAGVDGLPDAVNFKYAMIGNDENVIDGWAEKQTQDVLIYLIGNVQEGQFQLNETQRLASGDLDAWIDTLQKHIPGKATLIFDGCQSGAYISSLQPPATKERILISSTSGNQPAVFLKNGDICFSRFFWRYILNGANVYDAFTWTKSDIVYFGPSFMHRQVPVIDDNGNGIGNEKNEGSLAYRQMIGVGIMMADVPPMVGAVSPEQTLTGVASAEIWVQNVTGAHEIEEVWAVILSSEDRQAGPDKPVTALDTRALSCVGNGRYEAVIDGFDRFGDYQVVVYAKDSMGEVSAPVATRVRRIDAPDSFEDDDEPGAARIIVPGKPDFQRHNFHDAGDADWVRFYGLEGQSYEIRAVNLQAQCDIVIELYDTDGETLLREQDTLRPQAETADEILPWQCPEDGIYYVKFRHYDPTASGENTGYQCGISLPLAPAKAVVVFTEIQYSDGSPIGNAIVKDEGNAAAISEAVTGRVEITLFPGEHILTVLYPDGTTGQTEPFTVDENTTSIPPIILGLQKPVPSPAAMAATDHHIAGFKAQWTSVTDADYYLLDVSSDSAFGSFTDNYQGIAVTDTVHRVADLSPGTVYHYRVRAVNGAGISENSNVISTKTAVVGDPNGDGDVNLSDAIIGLKALADVCPLDIREDYLEAGTDVNGDNRLGLQDVIYDLQKAAELRQ
jgi:sugar lactone lactonase YvrE